MASEVKMQNIDKVEKSSEAIADRVKFVNYMMDRAFKIALALDDSRDDWLGFCSWCGKPLLQLHMNLCVAGICDNWSCQLFRSPQRYYAKRGRVDKVSPLALQ
jgi:hypothetical protein